MIDHVRPHSEALDWLAGDPGEGMAVMTEGAGTLIGTVRIMVRDRIAMLVSRLVQVGDYCQCLIDFPGLLADHDHTVRGAAYPHNAVDRDLAELLERPATLPEPCRA